MESTRNERKHRNNWIERIELKNITFTETKRKWNGSDGIVINTYTHYFRRVPGHERAPKKLHQQLGSEVKDNRGTLITEEF